LNHPSSAGSSIELRKYFAKRVKEKKELFQQFERKVSQSGL
jgi:hypothetical protein